MAKDRIVEFCARFGPRSIRLVNDKQSPGERGRGHVTSFLANKC